MSARTSVPARPHNGASTDLRPSDLAVLAAISDHTDDTGAARVTQRRLAADAGVSLRSVSAAVSRLRARGIVAVAHQHSPEYGMAAAEYRIVAAAVTA
jgi:DNA-binding MarR family transcriptional regulator